MGENEVYLFENCTYNSEEIYNILPDEVFSQISDARKVVLKPNWVKHAHMERPNDWDYVVTHPMVIQGVIKKVLDYIKPGGKITVIDGPEMTTKFDQLISHYPVGEWKTMAEEKDVEIEIIDLREDVWFTNGQLVTKREKQVGDPRGKTEVNLEGDLSEFYGHQKSKQGYFGADSNIRETNKAHDGHQNLYKLSKTVVEADVFINLPKLKTHKKAGITSCLKNLVGINTYRNYLPHYSIGTRKEGGDQFPEDSRKGAIESKLNPIFHQYIRTSPFLSKLFSPAMKIAWKIFGTNKKTNRSGSWWGNDTIWRMILDLNKALLYADPSGKLRDNNLLNRKKYIGVVDAILAGEGYGPKTPDPKKLNYILVGSNPAAIDSVGAKVMGFDPLRISSIKNAFHIKYYPIADFSYEEIMVKTEKDTFHINKLPKDKISNFIPASGWIGYIETNRPKTTA